jgi:hypothetical protein
MAKTSTEYKAQAVTRLGNLESSSKLRPPDAAQDDALADAKDTLDRLHPHVRIHEIVGDNVKRRWVLEDEIASWSNGTEQIMRLELVTDPGTDEELTTPVPEENWRQEKSTDDEDVLRLSSPVGDRTLRIHYRTPWVIDDDNADDTTIANTLDEGFISLIASKLAAWVARTASDQEDASLGADQIDLGGIAKRWAKRAEELRAAADEVLKPRTQDVAGAGGAIEWEPDSELGDSRYIGHGRGAGWF